MPARLNTMMASLVLGTALVTGCGSKSPTGGEANAPAGDTVPAARATAATTSTATSTAAATDGAPACMMLAPGIDMMGNAAGYLFIGDHPACTSPEDLHKFCAAMKTRPIYEKLEDANKGAESAAEVAAGLPEEARATYLATLPKHVLELTAQKCGLSVADLRSKLVAEADAAMKTDKPTDQYSDYQFILREDLGYAEALWKRECSGHVKLVETHSEAGDRFEVKGVSPAYVEYCTQLASKDGTSFKRPGADATAPQ
jgi:hypothetical protein